jgi:flagellar hook-associated protein 3 FlgL
MRVTEGMRYASALRSLGQLSARQAEAQNRAATGSRIDAPSSDPIAAAHVARIKATLAQADSHRDTIRSVQGDVEAAEGSLASAGDLLQRAREIAVQGANGALSAQDRATLATEANGLRDQMLAIANTRTANGYLFAGSKTNAAAFDASGAFQGDDVLHVVDIGGATPTAVGVSGARAFTALGGRDVLSDLAALGAALSANDRAAVAATLDGIDASHQQILRVRGQAGLTIDRLGTSDSTLQDLQTGLQKTAHQVGDADPYETYSTLTQLNASLQQAVAVTRQVLDLTTVNRF